MQSKAKTAIVVPVTRAQGTGGSRAEQMLRRILGVWKQGSAVGAKDHSEAGGAADRVPVIQPAPARRGRPKLPEPNRHALVVQLPRSHAEAVHRAARRRGCKPGDIVREALDDALGSGLVWAVRRGPKGDLCSVSLGVSDAVHCALQQRAAQQGVPMRTYAAYAVARALAAKSA